MFLVLARLRVVTYQLEKSPSLAGVHNVFHISQLKKCLKPPAHVIIDDVAPLNVDMSYPKHLVKLLGQQDRILRRWMIHFNKVQWSHQTHVIVL
jgi:hypothetical protein